MILYQLRYCVTMIQILDRFNYNQDIGRLWRKRRHKLLPPPPRPQAKQESNHHHVNPAFVHLFKDVWFKYTTAEPRFNDLRFNNITGITINIHFPGKSYSKMYGPEPQFNDLWFNDIPGLTMGICSPNAKSFPV